MTPPLTSPGPSPARGLRVIRPGPLTTVQDLGRPGVAHLGVSPSGAADRAAYRLVNRLLGNPDGAAALELTLGGLVLECADDGGPTDGLWVSLTGAPAPWWVDGRSQEPGTVAYLPPGGRLRVGAPRIGLRSYVGVRGGVDVTPVLGSRSTDLLGGLGPDPLRAGDVVPVGSAPDADLPGVGHPVDSRWSAGGRRARVAAGGGSPGMVAVDVGPRVDWFDEDAAGDAQAGGLRQLTGAEYVVGRDSNRVAVRLEGPPLTRVRGGELPSEGLIVGAVQVPPDGRPVVFLADHPTTGGYPVIAVVVEESLSVVAQARPGERIRFVSAWSSPRPRP